MTRMLIAACCLALLLSSPAAAPDVTFEFHSGFWVNLHRSKTRHRLKAPACLPI